MGYVFNPFTGTFDNAPSTVNGESAYSTVASNSADWGANPQVVEATIYNADSATLIRGNVVYSFGATGDTMSVKLASNSAESTSSKTLGFVNETITPGATGTVTIAGRMEHLPLGSPFVEGDALWLGSTPGSYTRVKPTAPNHGVYLGVAERANNGNGIAYVKVQNGYELNEIHDVSISGIAAGQVLRRNNANTLWQNVNDSTNWDSVYSTVQSNSASWTEFNFTNTKLVGKDYSTIQGCIDSVTGATGLNQTLILIPAGRYDENLTLKPCVSLASLGGNNGQSSIVRIVGNHVLTGSSVAGDSIIQMCGLRFDSTSSTTPTLSLSANGSTSLLVHMQDCMIGSASSSVSSVIVYVGPNVALKTNNVKSQAYSLQPGQGGTHFDIDGGSLYAEQTSTEYGTKSIVMRGSGGVGSYKPYCELKWCTMSCTGPFVMDINSDTALVAAGWSAFENLSSTGSGFNIRAGSVVGAQNCSFAVRSGVNNYVVTGTSPCYYYSLQNSYSNATGAVYETKVNSAVTPFVYTASNEFIGSKTYSVTVASGATTTTTVTCTGAETSHFAIATLTDNTGLTLFAYVNAANTVTVRLTNQTGSSITITSKTLKVKTFVQ